MKMGITLGSIARIATTPGHRGAGTAAHGKKSFTRDESGAIAFLFALSLPVLIGLVGLGVDAGMWFKELRNMQSATDAAAVSAAIERSYGATNAAMELTALSEAARHGYDATTDVLVLNVPPTSGTYAGDSDYVEVIITHQLETFLSQVITSINPESVTRAVATTVGNIDACMLSLAMTGSGIQMNSAAASVNMTGCGAFANSEDPIDSVNIQNGDMAVDCMWSHGGIDATIATATDAAGGAAADLVVSDECQVVEEAARVADPFANLAVPAYSGCNVGSGGINNLANVGGTPGLQNVGGSGNLTSPTVICGTLKVNAGDTLDVEPGVYIIHGGDLDVAGSATLNAPGVTFILAGDATDGYGGVKLNGGSTINWTAPTVADYSGLVDSGTNNFMGSDYTNYTGITIYQSAPDAGGGASTRDVILTGGTNALISGAVYAPNNDISYGGNAGLMPSDCLQLVGQVVSFNGSATINNNCSIYGGNPVAFGARPGLVE